MKRLRSSIKHPYKKNEAFIVHLMILLFQNQYICITYIVTLSFWRNTIPAGSLMKYLKLLYVFLILLPVFTAGSASGRSPEPSCAGHLKTGFISFDNTLITSAFVIKYKELDVHFKFKSRVKNRATASESDALNILYSTKPALFTIFKNSLIYGIEVIYQIQRHNYLHLYQLF